MDGWAYMWKCEWMDRHVYEWMAIKLDGWMGIHVDGWMSRWMSIDVDEWMDGHKDGWKSGLVYMGGWVYGWMVQTVKTRTYTILTHKCNQSKWQLLMSNNL